MAIEYQTVVFAAGLSFVCVESYESIFERVRSSAFQMHAEDEEMVWAAPLELTTKGEKGPLRLALNAHSIAGVLELHEEDRTKVE